MAGGRTGRRSKPGASDTAGASALIFTIDDLPAGTYAFWCEVEQHASQGMVGTLTTDPQPSPAPGTARRQVLGSGEGDALTGLHPADPPTLDAGFGESRFQRLASILGDCRQEAAARLRIVSERGEGQIDPVGHLEG